jgi:hypothetical protein
VPWRLLRGPRTCSAAGCDVEIGGQYFGRDNSIGRCR